MVSLTINMETSVTLFSSMVCPHIDTVNMARMGGFQWKQVIGNSLWIPQMVLQNIYLFLMAC